MKKCLWVLINKIFKEDLILLYGENSEIFIETIKYCTNNHQYLVSCTLKVENIDLFKETGMDGVNYLIEDAWPFMGFNNGVVVVSSVDLV